MGIPMRWTTVSVRPITRPAVEGLARFVGHPEDDEDEQCGQHDFRDESAAHPDVDADVAPNPSVPSPVSGCAVQGRGSEDPPEHEGAETPPMNWAPNTDGVHQRETSSDQCAHGHRGIDVTARYRPERVGQGQQDESEREGRGDDPRRELPPAT